MEGSFPSPGRRPGAWRVPDVGRAAFEIYEDRSGEHRWRLRHRNGNVLLDSGEGYDDRGGARDGVESVKLNGATAEIDDSGA